MICAFQTRNVNQSVSYKKIPNNILLYISYETARIGQVHETGNSPLNMNGTSVHKIFYKKIDVSRRFMRLEESVVQVSMIRGCSTKL